MTQLENAKKGVITKEMKIVAKEESIDPKKLIKDIAMGHTVIVKSSKHECRPLGIGKDLKIKINSNIGTSNLNSDIEKELEKLKASIKYGADTVMDLSTGGDIDLVRKKILSESDVPIGTVPIYQAITKKSDIAEITEEDFLESIKNHIEDGVDFITVHCGLTQKCIPLLKSRIMGVVSRGGSFLVKWMIYHKKENPLYTRYDEILELAKKYDVVLSLGDGLRPGCLADATDEAQITELKTLGELAKKAKEKGVQIIIEGPGHVPLDQIKKNIELQKEYCGGAPFYVLGPLVTDISPGYDHLTGAIGGAIAATYGADYLCYLTPTEHLGLPDTNHVIEGVIASKIAAHAADIARGIKGARNRDDEMSKARSNLDWKTMYKLALNPEKAKSMRQDHLKDDSGVCTMCGDFCSAKINKECRKDY
ncbi:MAG: phosphomethylpyrimidine synthase ThiC [Nanoarchaeota archaeon]|nr:phosphomethylpyrimidine synthase ThiC [Nanoarchaeota archaeon]